MGEVSTIGLILRSGLFWVQRGDGRCCGPRSCDQQARSSREVLDYAWRTAGLSGLEIEACPYA